MTKTVTPKYLDQAFNCPRCGVLCPQNWFAISRIPGEPSAKLSTLDINAIQSRRRSVAFVGNVPKVEYTQDWKLEISICHHCEKYTIWENNKIIYPFYHLSSIH